MEVETIEADSKDLAEILTQATSGDEIIFESDVIEDGDNEDVEEIVEIIEEIEEIEEVEEVEEVEEEAVETEEAEEVEEPEGADDDEIDEHMSLSVAETEHIDMSSLEDGEVRSSEKSSQQMTDVDVKISQSRSEYVKKQLKNHFKNGSEKERSKQVVTYDVDKDWEDDDLDQAQQYRNESSSQIRNIKKAVNNQLERDERQSTQNGKKQSMSLNHGSLSQSSNSRMHAKILHQQGSADENTNEYWDEEEQESIVGYEDDHSGSQNEENTDSQHEIVKNAENNLVYTVLGSKKQNIPNRRNLEERFEGSRFIKMEQLDDNPNEATIYYQNEDMDTLYVGQSTGDSDHYEYNNIIIGDQEGSRDSNREDAEMDDRDEESQEQIFLHEDEDGQLYFKDESGKLQPVYLTADGNYAIAENSSDDQDSRDQNRQGINLRQPEGGAVLLSGVDYIPGTTTKTAVVPASAIQEIDNEDNTVTISLIISEDENGQKRTQVIIPTTDNLKCETCNKSFKTSFQLLRHNRLKHARDEELTSRNYPCDLCPKRYPDQNSLVRHRKTHTGDRPFQCLECQKTFPSSTALRRHLTLHNPQSRPLPCIYCGRRFLDKSSLAKHEQSHLGGEQRTHTCDICHKAFIHASDLALHKKNHDPERKFDCEVCGREFNRLNNLQRHMMVHQQGNNDEALSCDVCGITYKFMSSLTRHMVTTHVNPEKMRQQAEEQRRKRENNYRRYMENRKMYECQPASGYSNKRTPFHHNAVTMSMQMSDNDDDA